MSSYNIAGLISEVSEEVATQIAKNCRPVVNNPTLIWGPRQQEPPRLSVYIPYISRNYRDIGLHFCRCMYGSTFIQICAVGSKRRIFSATECVLGVQGRSGSFKVDEFGFGINRTRVNYFLLVGHCNYGSILHRFWDSATYWLKIAYFPYPSLTRRPCFPCFLWNFALKLTVRKLL